MRRKRMHWNMLETISEAESSSAWSSQSCSAWPCESRVATYRQAREKEKYRNKSQWRVAKSWQDSPHFNFLLRNSSTSQMPGVWCRHAYESAIIFKLHVCTPKSFLRSNVPPVRKKILDYSICAHLVRLSLCPCYRYIWHPTTIVELLTFNGEEKPE